MKRSLERKPLNKSRSGQPPRLTPHAGLTIQPKLETGNPANLHEREADAMADHIIDDIDTPRLDTTSPSTPGPLPAQTRSFMEDAFSADFSTVTVHADEQSATLNRNLHAKAFTLGNDIYFNKDQYNPSTPSGGRLLAHELTHVVQQGAAPQTATTSQTATPQITPAAPAIACDVEDWLQGDLDTSHWGYSEFIKEADKLDFWVNTQIEGTEDTDRIRQISAMLRAQAAANLTQPGAKKPPKPAHSRKRSKSAKTDDDPPAPAPAPTSDEAIPRILKEKTSVEYADPDDLHQEVDRIIDWLRRKDLSKKDRAILRSELEILAPQFAQDRAKQAYQRQSAAVAAAISPQYGDFRTKLLDTVAKFDSIRPLTGRPGFNYLLNGTQMLIIPDEQLAALRQVIMKNLDDAAEKLKKINDATEYRWQNWYNTNYEDDRFVGFVVSGAHGSDPMDLWDKMSRPLSLSNNTLNQFWPHKTTHVGSLYDRALAIADASEKADQARTIVDEDIEGAVNTAGKIVSGLEVVEEAAIVVDGALLAAAAAPAAAGFFGAEGLGLGATGTFLGTTAATGTVVGLEGAVQGGITDFAGAKAAGKDTADAFRAAGKGALKHGEQSFVLGASFGATGALAESLGVAEKGISIANKIGRSVAAGAGGNLTGSLIGSALEGRSLRATVDNAAFSLLTGSASGGLGAGTSYLNNPLLAKGALAVGNTALLTASTYAQGGSTEDILNAGAQGFLTSLVTANPQRGAAARRSGADLGQSVRSNVRALSLAAGTGLYNALPYSRGIGVSSLNLEPPSISAPLSANPVTTNLDPSTTPTAATTPTTTTPPTTAATPDQAPTTQTTAPPAATTQTQTADSIPRTTTRQQYYAQQSAGRFSSYLDRKLANLENTASTPAVVHQGDEAFQDGRRVYTDQDLGVNKEKHRERLDIGNIPARPGETQQQAVERVRGIIGVKVSELDELRPLWEDARASILSKNTLTEANAKSFYNKVRRAFNYRVWRNPAAREMLARFGFGRTGGEYSNPVLLDVGGDINQKQSRVSFDHELEKATHWQRALDADNLILEFEAPNTERENIQVRDPNSERNLDDGDDGD